jgi:hypothetical protein
MALQIKSKTKTNDINALRVFVSDYDRFNSKDGLARKGRMAAAHDAKNP